MRLITKNNFGEEKAALLDNNNNVSHFFIRRPERLNLGEELAGIIRKKDAVLRGYFVETEKKLTVFVPSRETLTEGSRVCVKITKEARRGKDANGIFINACQPFPSLSTTLSTNFNITPEEIWDTLNLDEVLEDTLASEIVFADGASIIIERTNACWTIDIDTKNSNKSFSELNMLATEIIAHEIKKRHIGGIIIIDFIGPKHKSEQINLEQHLKKLFHDDSQTKLMGWSKAKLFELTRSRTYAPLIDVFLDKTGESNTLTTVYKITDIFSKSPKVSSIEAHPNIIQILREKLKNRVIFKTNIQKPIHFFDIKE